MARSTDKHDCDPRTRTGGVIHTYRGYDPQRFPLPDDMPADLVSPAFEHMLAYGSLRQLTAEELAEAVEIDPAQIAGLGPSIESLLAVLEQRKRKILETFETDTVQVRAHETFHHWASHTRPPRKLQSRFDRAIRDEQIIDLERLWYKTDQRSDFARQLVVGIEHLGNTYQVEELASKYVFSGRKPMTIDKALEVKEELEAIDRLIEQLKQAAKDAKVYLIDMEALARFASEQEMQGLESIAGQVEELLRHLAEQQGLQTRDGQLELTPKAMKLMQSKLLLEIFSDLQPGKTGRHETQIGGDGAVEMQRSKPYEFGDSLANMDVTSSLINAMIRRGSELPIRIKPRDIEIHLTRNNPKCATVVCMDMSGSMRWGGQYINVKRMALALHGLIRSEYPGDFLDFVEIYTLPKRRHVSEVPQLLPKPVTIRDSVVRLKADMRQEGITDIHIPPHFTNIQHGLKLARQLLQVQDTPNRQIVLITDGLPTAHFEDHWLYLLYPPHPRTEQFTLCEAMLCKDQGVVINIFLLSSWSQSQEDIQFAHRLTEQTRGRVFFTASDELDRFVVWDYVKRRRSIIG